MGALIFLSMLLSVDADSTHSIHNFKGQTFSYTPLVFHHPERVLFNVRAFDLEVFVKFPKTMLQSISLFYKTDAMNRFLEIQMDPGSDRYRYRYDPLENPANKITYFFVISTTDGKLYATPVDSSGMLIPQTKHLLNPKEYFKKRAALRE